MKQSSTSTFDPFPTIVHSTLFEDVKDLNDKLLEFVKSLVLSEKDASEQIYLTTEGANQPDIDIVREYYGEVDCITEFVDEIMLPCAEKWTKHHFLELIGNPDYSGYFDYVSWATYYTPGSWQTPHIHRDKMFTGVYFVKMPPVKESPTNGAHCTSGVQIQPPDMRSEGAFVIQNPHPQSSQPLRGGWQTHKEILPQEGELIIIPSWLSHYPKPFSSGERCVIVFDAEYKL